MLADEFQTLLLDWRRRFDQYLKLSPKNGKEWTRPRVELRGVYLRIVAAAKAMDLRATPSPLLAFWNHERVPVSAIHAAYEAQNALTAESQASEIYATRSTEPETVTKPTAKNGQPDEITLEKEEVAILKALYGKKHVLRVQVEIADDTSLDRKTVRAKLKSLSTLGFVCQPKGTKKGWTVTEKATPYLLRL